MTFQWINVNFYCLGMPVEGYKDACVDNHVWIYTGLNLNTKISICLVYKSVVKMSVLS